jgi:hypothetical protein
VAARNTRAAAGDRIPLKRAELPDEVTTVVGDATRVDDVVRAMTGAVATMFCVNPPLATWLTAFQPLLECAIRGRAPDRHAPHVPRERVDLRSRSCRRARRRRNGNYEHGRYTAETIAWRRWLRGKTREVRALTRTVDWYSDRDPVLRAEHLERANDPSAAEAYRLDSTVEQAWTRRMGRRRL